MLTDIEIAQSAKPRPISEIARKLGISPDLLEPHGRFKAKIPNVLFEDAKSKPDGKLILVTAISPTPPGEGKTTTSVGLSDALNLIGKKTVVCLREPSIGPTFGLKGGATGGGYAQVVPMEEINLHFTGDFHAIQLAHNLLAALIDNHIHHGNELQIDVRRVAWKRVLDVNDRALREIVVGMGGTGNGFAREDGFDIVVASEVMAIFCLANSLGELKRRLGNIVIAYNRDQKPVYARDLKAEGAMAALLKDAFLPNLVQTLEGNPAIIHGGPFANIAHGCNSVVATKLALKLGDYVVTEAGFGADLGAEKFMDIKCRKSGLKPDAAVIVATIRALKYHGGMELADLGKEDVAALTRGVANLERHVRNVRDHYGLPCVVALNQFASDSPAEIAALKELMSKPGASPGGRCDKMQGTEVVLCRHWAEGGKGATDLARAVVAICEKSEARPKLLYEDSLPLWEKVRAVATKIYGAADIQADSKVREQFKKLQESGYGHFPVCIAKTQYSFSTDPRLKGAPSGHVISIREVRLSAGAEFVVVICGDIMTMPGLPKVPAAHRIDIDESGKITGLS